MRPGGPPNPRAGKQQSTLVRSRRLRDLTLQLPQRDLKPLAALLPPSSAPSSTSSSRSSLGAPTPPTSAGSAPPPLSELVRVRRIGSGSGGTVWMVRHRPTGRPYALKVLYGNHDAAVRRQITREVAILRTAEHPAVVRCHGMYEQAGELQILLEYMDGGSLEGRRIASEPFLADVARQVLSGIAYLHRHHIVHRDIKPSNLLIDSGRRVKIADFGVGRILNQTMDPCNSSVGTIAYISPERITDLNDSAYDGYAGDIWSFGMSILEFYLGRFPLGENLGKQGDWAALMCAICYSDSPAPPPIASPEFKSFISCCLQKNPARRPSATQLLQHRFCQREDGDCEYSELTKKFKRQKIDKDAWRIFSNEDSSDTRNQDSDRLARVEEQLYTLCKDVNAWLAMVKQCQKGLYHTCMQQAPRQLLGRDDIKQRIAEKLLGSNGESNSTVICIVAGSGLGKTSLLRVLHNDQQLLDAFDKRICIQMSDKFDKLMLFRNIIEYAMHDHCSITNLSFLEEMVKEELADKKFLFFLDDADIEDQQFWTSALEILNAGVKGSAAVIATRSTTVADFTAGALHSYYLDPLSEESNLMLLQQYACMGQDIHSNPDLVAIAKRFIARFGANPLKLKALGVFLFHSDTIPLDEGRFEGDTVPCLQLCHDILPIYLKQCLAFCSLFPKGYIFDKHHMVLLWLSRGFIVPAEGRELEDIGVGYFHELLCRSFFQYSPFHNEKDNKFVMHELIYNVVVSISHDKYFKSEDPLSHVPENICHLSLVSSQFQTVQLASRTEELKDLQTFLVVQPEWQQRKISFPTLNFCLNDFFLKFRSLETLDLSYTDIEELPSSIVGLRNLRYLSLNNTSIRALPPELCSLSNLQTLEAKDCHFLTELPEDTRKLFKLRHLNVGKKLDYVRMPRGVGQLTELRTVPVFHVGGGLSHCSINELGNLYSLRGCLLVAGLENVRNGGEALEANLNYKQHLQDLTLQWYDSGVDIDDDNEEAAENVAEQVLESLQPHANLQELAIRRYQGNEFPSWMEGSSFLPSLVSLTLDSCCSCTRFPAIAQLPSLKFLSVRKMYEVQRLSSDTHGAIKFPCLELLNLWEMYGLEELFEVSEGDCPRLRKICISRCPYLKRLPCIPSVVELVLHCCDQLPDIPELASLASLKIEGFHGVRSLSLPPQLPALRKLDIRGCNELSSVHGLSVLTAVKIAGCPKLDLSKN